MNWKLKKKKKIVHSFSIFLPIEDWWIIILEIVFHLLFSFSARESGSCKKKHPCTEMDYYEYQTPCDKGGQVSDYFGFSLFSLHLLTILKTIFNA